MSAPPTYLGRRQALSIKRMNTWGFTEECYLQCLSGIKSFLAPAYLGFGSILIASRNSRNTCRSGDE